MVNRYAAPCCYCKATVPPSGGRCWRRGARWIATHEACALEARAARKPGSPRRRAVDSFVIGGKDFIRNSRGRCEDAPCCGCCTI